MRTVRETTLAQIAHTTAYVVLPQKAHGDAADLFAQFEQSPDLGAVFYFLLAAASRGTEPNPEDVRSLRGHTGRFDRDRKYIVIEYPRVPEFDVQQEFKSESPTWSASHVLAPYFSAVVDDRANREVKCLALGQSLDGDPTLRCVSPTQNVNLGPGCEPELEEFLQLVRRRTN